MSALGLHGVIRGQKSSRCAPRCPTKGPRRARSTASTGTSEPPAPNMLLAVRLHLREHLVGLRVRGLRDRRLRPPHRRLAGEQDGARQLRPRRSRAGSARPAARSSRRARAPFGTAARNMLEFATPSAWPRRASSRPSAASATATTTRSPRRSTASTRPRSSIGVAPGAASRPSSTPPRPGSSGSTIAASWRPSAISRQPRRRNATTPRSTSRAWPRNSNQTASGKPGAVQLADAVGYGLWTGADRCRHPPRRRADRRRHSPQKPRKPSSSTCG